MLPMRSILINNKKIRAEVIKEFLGEGRAFCFSSGNASYALRKAGVNLIAISPYDALVATRFVRPEEAEYYFQAFNATSGYLPTFLLERIAKKLQKRCVAALPSRGRLFIPFGSGELIFVFSFFFPLNRIVAVTSDYAPLAQDNTSPLAAFVEKNCLKIIKADGAKSIKDIKSIVGKKMKGGDVFVDTSPADWQARLLKRRIK